MAVDLLDHLVIVTAAMDLEAQTGAQSDQLEQVGGYAPEVTVAVEKGQWGQRFVDHDPHDGMLRQPALFTVAELQLLIGEKNVTARTPAFGDVFSLAARGRLEDGVDDPEQSRVALVYGEAETVGLVFTKVGHADVV